MTERTQVANLNVATSLYNFVNQEVIPGTGLEADNFWQAFSNLTDNLVPENRALLAKRDQIQQQLDEWHRDHKGNNFNFAQYKSFLKEINYLVEPVEDFEISTTQVDAEMATLAGPQLVVPIMNARFALNAANARWGSLYDALYGTDAISEADGADKSKSYNPVRGTKVIAFARDFLDQSIPLSQGSYHDVKSFALKDNALIIELTSGQTAELKNQSQFVGYQGNKETPSCLLFKNNGLHFEVQFDSASPIAQGDIAGISDVLMEAALSTIMDCEDSVAAVDADDKVLAYKNWLGLIKGNLTEEVSKAGKTFTRTINADRQYTALNESSVTLKGRSLMFVRNVGHLMTNNAILQADGTEIPEGIMDAVITSLISLHDIQGNGQFSNSTQGSIYIVKPKMHGPEEVGFACRLFEAVEQLLNLPLNTIKMGIMDEERRTTVNLKACIYAAKERVVFINTGFLDRTGDEIHTSMEAGPMERKGDIKNTPWIGAYENANVDIGLACGLSGKAQIGKGMWAMPDLMAEMLANKVSHPKSGANTAWVPSPTAAVLHALHYHQVNVFELQKELAKRSPANIDDILTFPVAQNPAWSAQEIQAELDNNAQGILGYVVRWIDQGVGCSKVLDINNIGLMEDRATLRISSQHIANWLHHNVCTEEQVMSTLKRMAQVVDTQNANDPLYQPMAANFEQSIAFQAACELVFEGCKQPNGYTEPVLHRRRLQKKQQIN